MRDKIAVHLKAELGALTFDVAFSAPTQGIIAIYGPSACGKTSLLRAIAGLQRFNGYVRIGQDIWQDARTFVPVHKRPIGYVFQEPSLFPHLSVRRNLMYGASAATDQQAFGFFDIVALLDIAHLIERAPHYLSGGERQRVAIGRALLSQPKMLLMDEPLAALDEKSRSDILPLIEKLRDQLGLPVFYISHDINEVERLANHLILLDQGRVLASGSLHDIQINADLPLAQSRQAGVSLDGQIVRHDEKNGLMTVVVNGGHFLVPAFQAKGRSNLRLRIAAAGVSVSVDHPAPSSVLNVLPAKIISAKQFNTFERLAVLALGSDGGGAHILARISNHSWHRLSLQCGLTVFAQIKGVSLIAEHLLLGHHNSQNTGA